MVGFVNRIVYAAGLRVAINRPKALCYGLTYPLALVGRLTQPYRGLDIFFDQVANGVTSVTCCSPCRCALRCYVPTVALAGQRAFIDTFGREVLPRVGN
jgi:hypothetical protein